MEVPIIDKFDGSPVIILNPGKYQFMFGVKKAKLFLGELHQIREHVKHYTDLYKKSKVNDSLGDKNLLKAKLILNGNTEYPVELSIYKCEAIIGNIESIKSFINSNA